jgi:hypothetical protein
MPVDPRHFLVGSFGATVLASLAADLLADSAVPPLSAEWDNGLVRHLLPTVSETGMLLYDVRRTMTLAGASAVFVDLEVERWLRARTAGTDTTHLVHAPSNPPGWSAGKWGEWYPDILGGDGKLTTSQPKPYWQTGWLAQHDRLMTSLAAMRDRVPLVVSGDLHAIAMGRMLRCGSRISKRILLRRCFPVPLGRDLADGRPHVEESARRRQHISICARKWRR